MERVADRQANPTRHVKYFPNRLAYVHFVQQISMMMKKIVCIYIPLILWMHSGCSQAARIGGGCDGCELIYTNAPAFDQLSWTDTLPDFNEPGPKLLITGTIYRADGRTPAEGVVLYIYHTDQTGHYTRHAEHAGQNTRHGYIRGWMKTNEKGQYRFYTLKPKAYPGNQIPAHIHPIIKEPAKNEYYIDEYRFDDDPLLTKEERSKEEKRGGSGIISLRESNGTLYGVRNIYLGKNIPDYAVKK